MGVARRGGGACVRRRGRGRLPAPLPREALSARREATAVGSIAGLCSGDFGGGGGASGTSALVSSARLAGSLRSELGGRTCSLSMCGRWLTGAGGAWGRAGWRGMGWGGRAGRARVLGPGAHPGRCAGGGGRGCCRRLGARCGVGVGDRTAWPGESEPRSLWGGGCLGEAFRCPESSWPEEEPRAEWGQGFPWRVFRGQEAIWLGGVWVGRAAGGQGAEPRGARAGAGFERS